MKNSTIRLLMQGGLAVIALVGLIIVGAIQGDSPTVRVLELILVAALGFLYGHQGGKANGDAAHNGS